MIPEKESQFVGVGLRRKHNPRSIGEKKERKKERKLDDQMSKRSLAILLRARMRSPPVPLSQPHDQHHPSLLTSPSHDPSSSSNFEDNSINFEDNSISSSANQQRITAKDVKEWMHESISIPTGSKQSADATLQEFSQGYLKLPNDERYNLLISLAKDYDLNRAEVRNLMTQYLNLEISHKGTGEDEDGGNLSILYRMERNLRDSLKPIYDNFFERLNANPGGLKLLSLLRADLLSLLAVKNVPSLRALDSYLKEKLITWLSPAALELHHITWDDSASLLEKIVEYEAVHPIRNLIDLKRRLGVGRRCFGYFHPAIPGEPLIFIEVALLKDIASSIEEVLWDDPPISERESRCALFYSISSTQAGLSGINLGKFLLKRVVEMLRKDMPYIQKYATLSPIPGFMQWLNAKLASQLKLIKSETGDSSDSTFKETILLPNEEKIILESFGEEGCGKSGMEIMYEMLQSKEWKRSERLCTVFKSPLMRLCTRYLLKEKKRGKALDAVANFHLQNGAFIERINWMADQSEKGIQQSGGIMVNYVYRLENIEEYAQEYFNTGHIHAAVDLYHSLEMNDS